MRATKLEEEIIRRVWRQPTGAEVLAELLALQIRVPKYRTLAAIANLIERAELAESGGRLYLWHARPEAKAAEKTAHE